MPDVITWTIISAPGPHDESRVISAIERGFEIWEEHNPELSFNQISEGGDILIHWKIEPNPNSLGSALETRQFKGIITLQIGNYNCEGTYVEYHSDSLTDTTMHEIGHILGLEHHIDPEHLMYGIDEFTQDPFDTLGYSIPEGLPNDGYFVGEILLRDRLDKLAQELDVLAQELDVLAQERNELDQKMNDILDRVGITQEEYFSIGGPVDIVDAINPLVNKYNQSVNKSEQLWSKYNLLKYEFDLIKEKITCYHTPTLTPPNLTLQIKEQQASIDSLTKIIVNLMNRIATLENNTSNLPDTLTVDAIIRPTFNSHVLGCEDTLQGCFIPPVTTINVGEVVSFLNTDIATHTFNAGNFGDTTREFNSGSIMAGTSFEYQTTTVGNIPYHCIFHPWMVGLIIVQE